MDTAFEWIILASAVILALVTSHKYVFKPLVHQSRKFNRAADAMLGYPAVLDPATGRIIQPPTAAMADRVKDLEDAHVKIAEALTTLANTQQNVMTLQAKWEEREKVGTAIVEEWTAWRHEIEKDFAKWRLEQDELAALIRQNIK